VRRLFSVKHSEHLHNLAIGKWKSLDNLSHRVRKFACNTLAQIIRTAYTFVCFIAPCFRLLNSTDDFKCAAGRPLEPFISWRTQSQHRSATVTAAECLKITFFRVTWGKTLFEYLFRRFRCITSVWNTVTVEVLTSDFEFKRTAFQTLVKDIPKHVIFRKVIVFCNFCICCVLVRLVHPNKLQTHFCALFKYWDVWKLSMSGLQMRL